MTGTINVEEPSMKHNFKKNRAEMAEKVGRTARHLKLLTEVINRNSTAL